MKAIWLVLDWLYRIVLTVYLLLTVSQLMHMVRPVSRWDYLGALLLGLVIGGLSVGAIHAGASILGWLLAWPWRQKGNLKEHAGSTS